MDNNFSGENEVNIHKTPINNNQESAELYYNKIETTADGPQRRNMNTIQARSDDVIESSPYYNFKLNNGEVDDELVQIETTP